MSNILTKKNLANEQYWWWLHSAYSGISRYVGCVDVDGRVDGYDAYYNFGVAATCLII